MIKNKLMIYWLSQEEGGRSMLYRGDRYAVPTRFSEEGNENKNWTMMIEFRPSPHEQGNPSVGLGQFLSEEAPQEWLQIGKRFELYEGPKLVAHADVIE